MENLVLTLIASVGGAGAASYFGSKIALAEVRRDIHYLQQDVRDIKLDIARLERPYFKE